MDYLDLFLDNPQAYRQLQPLSLEVSRGPTAGLTTINHNTCHDSKKTTLGLPRLTIPTPVQRN